MANIQGRPFEEVMLGLETERNALLEILVPVTFNPNIKDDYVQRRNANDQRYVVAITDLNNTADELERRLRGSRVLNLGLGVATAAGIGLAALCYFGPGSSATQPTLAPVTPSQVEQVQEPDVSAYKWKFEQSSGEHEKFIRGEVKYADLSDRVKAWFSLQHPKAELRQEGNKYSIAVTPSTTYKGNDLEDFRIGVKVGDRWYFGLRPNQTANISLEKGQYDALGSQAKPVGQLIMYKVEGDKSLRIYSSINYGRVPVEPSREEQRPTLPPKVTAPKGDEPMVVLPQAEKPPVDFGIAYKPKSLLDLEAIAEKPVGEAKPAIAQPQEQPAAPKKKPLKIVPYSYYLMQQRGEIPPQAP